MSASSFEGGALQSFLEWAIYTDALRLASALMYVIFAVGLWSLGAQYQSAIVHKDRPPGQFPEGYFTMFAIQLIPLTLTGFVLHDTFVVATRLGTLAMVLLVYGMISSADGTYNTRGYRVRILFWLSVAIMGPMMWMENPRMQTFVHDWEKVIAYSSVVAMLAFVIWGQGVAAKALFQHFVQGNYTIKRFNLQIVRFFGFGLQALHYGFGPLMTAKPFGWTDPIFLQGAIGTTGVSFVLVWAMIGMIRGRHARREHRGINRP